tara:strand:+ start:560 stop:1195 length:636 start_codon:yes stop_codon:yes gene_type:complete
MINNCLRFFLKSSLNIFSNNYLNHKNIILKILGAKISKKVSIAKDVFFNLSKPQNLTIKENTVIGKNTLIKIREDGKLVINKNCSIEEDCRIIAAREGTLIIGDYSNVGCSSHLISGGILEIGSDTLISPFCYICSSKVKTKKGVNIMTQDYEHGKIIIGNDVLVGRLATITSGCNIKDGTIIGSSAYVKISTEENGIYVGTPLKNIGFRS